MPSVKLALPALPVYDPKREILDKIGDLSGYEIANNEVLLAIYMRPERTAGGIILTDGNRKEDRYQGKVHLVLKIGESCQFLRKEPDSRRFYGLDIKLHDWVLMNPSHGWALDINTRSESTDVKDFVPCRMAYDDGIRARVPSPTMIW